MNTLLGRCVDLFEDVMNAHDFLIYEKQMRGGDNGREFLVIDEDGHKIAELRIYELSFRMLGMTRDLPDWLVCKEEADRAYCDRHGWAHADDPYGFEKHLMRLADDLQQEEVTS